MYINQEFNVKMLQNVWNRLQMSETISEIAFIFVNCINI